MSNLFLAIGIIAVSVSCVFISLSLKGLEKRVSDLEDVSELQTTLLTLIVSRLSKLEKINKNCEKE